MEARPENYPTPLKERTGQEKNKKRKGKEAERLENIHVCIAPQQLPIQSSPIASQAPRIATKTLHASFRP